MKRISYRRGLDLFIIFSNPFFNGVNLKQSLSKLINLCKKFQKLAKLPSYKGFFLNINRKGIWTGVRFQLPKGNNLFNAQNGFLL